MSAPRKYDQEFRERAVRMYRDRLAEPGESKRGARRHVGVLLDLNPETLRNWAEERDRVDFLDLKAQTEGQTHTLYGDVFVRALGPDLIGLLGSLVGADTSP